MPCGRDSGGKSDGSSDDKSEFPSASLVAQRDRVAGGILPRRGAIASAPTPCCARWASSRARASPWPTRCFCGRRSTARSNAIAGSYVTARLAPDRPRLHALAGGAVGLALSIVGAVLTWNRGPDFGPHWYPLALVATALPCAWVGGMLRGRQLRSPSAR
jgi:hypothetical protein